MPEDAELRAAGDRIAALLESLSTTTEPKVWAKVEEVLGLVTELYGGALARVMVMAPPDMAAALAEDDLVASLLIVHGLHPDGLRQRVERALEEVRPALGSHGGDVSLVDVDELSGEVVLQMLGSCDGCPSSAITLKLAVERAITEAAPEVREIRVVEAEKPGTPINLSSKPIECPSEVLAQARS